MCPSHSSMRPGITVDYAPIPAAASDAPACVGVIAPAPQLSAVEALAVERFSDFSAAYAQYGDSPLSSLIRAVFDNAPADVSAVRVNAGDTAQYQEAVELLAAQAAVSCIVSGDPDPDIAQSAAQLLADSSHGGGKLFFAGCPAGEDAALLAESINCERVILTAPPVYPLDAPEQGPDLSPAIVAAIVLRQDSPASNLFGEEVLGDYGISAPLTETALQELLRRGVTVLEPGSLCPEVIRGVTTRTLAADGSPDYSMRNISVPRTVDAVAESLTAVLTRRLSVYGIDLSSLSALVEWELLRLKEEENLISAYDKPALALDSEDPSVCDITVGFTVRQGAAQILLHLRYE